MNATTDANETCERLASVAQENRMLEARRRAFVYLHDVRETKPATYQEAFIEHMNNEFRRTLDTGDDVQLAMLCIVDAIAAAKTQADGKETANGILALAESDLL